MNMAAGMVGLVGARGLKNRVKIMSEVETVHGKWRQNLCGLDDLAEDLRNLETRSALLSFQEKR
jgi:hypothetical protein